MKIVHLSDLHLGKRLNEFSMLEDQEYILAEIIDIIDSENPAAIIVAGDVYDKAVPPADAVQLFDDFLYSLSERGLQVFIISGNHDSPERIAFGSRLMYKSGIHMSPVYNGSVVPVTMRDDYGSVNIYMLPFVKPSGVRRFFEDDTIDTYTDALRAAITQMNINTSERNILVTHQFVTGALRCDSESISVGGSDNVDASVFDDFDYVALGHIHKPQYIGRDAVRYSGTPLKYSFSEINHEKSVTVVNVLEKGSIDIYTIPLKPRHDLREVRGTYMELTAKQNYEGTATDDYLHIVLTDEEDIPDAIGRLRAIYPNIMSLDYDNRRTAAAARFSGAENVESKTPLELFAELYEKQNGQPMSEEQAELSGKLMEEIWGLDI